MFQLTTVIGLVVTGNVMVRMYKYTLRKATRWEDPDTPEFEQKKIKEFLDRNKDAEVIKLNPNPENYF